MKYKLNEEQKTLIQDAEKQCLSKYKIDNEDYIEIESLLNAIEDLEYEIDRLNEKYEDLKNERENENG